MTLKQLKLGLAVTAVFVGSVAANLLVLQPMSERAERPARPFRGLDHLPGVKSDTHDAAKTATAAIGAERGATPAQAESATAVVRHVQQSLSARGYLPGDADGVQGVVTRAAIMAFEHDQGLPLTGEASLTLVAALESSGSASAAAGSAAAAPPSPEAEQIIRTVQQSLERLGYRPGPTDGRVGSTTAAAIRGFERDHNLPESGRISGLLLVHLARQAERGRLAAR
ncbi:MAG: peptidoglycan-binding protein [Hyphomicrobiaceae bacterium]